MDKFVIQKRTRVLALNVIKMTKRFPKSEEESKIISNQVIRSATSTACNYRSACRGRSHKEFTAKLGIVIEECDETLFWVEFAEEAGLVSEEFTKEIKKEANEILSIIVASVKTAKDNEHKY